MDHQIKLLAQVAHPMPTISGPGIVPDNNPNLQLENIISTIFGFLTIVAVIYFVIQIIFAGFSFLSSQGDKEKLKSARDRLTNGILGLTIVVIAFGIGVFLTNLMGLKGIFDLDTIFTSLKLQ